MTRGTMTLLKVGIDASNLYTGGSITHLSEALRAADPERYGICSIVVWGGSRTLDRLENRTWLIKRHLPILDGNLVQRAYWQRFRLSQMARQEGCHVLFVPGGSFAGDFRPVVTMSRNMLPFEWREARRYGFSWMTLKLLLLRWTQLRSYRHADGVIFLTQYARSTVMQVVGETRSRITTVPHGIDARFVCEPRAQREIAEYSESSPFRLLYVSTIDMYKHHVPLVQAVSSLRQTGLPVVLDLVGNAYGPAWRNLCKALERNPAHTHAITYQGPLPHSQLPAKYFAADLCVFASSCENMPNVLLEAMASGLPIACSDRGPMPEVLGDSGLYFDPEDPNAIEDCLRRMIESASLRKSLALASFERAKVYSWRRCAQDTFAFISDIGSNSARSVQ